MRNFSRFVASVGTVAVLLVGPSPAQAQWHGYGPGHGHVTIGIGVGFGFGWYPFYSPWYPWYPYSGWYGYGWGYPPYPYPYPYYPYYPYGYSIDTLTASLRLEVKPSDADVYVDGYMAGKVDNFDGMFQRLHVRPGEHDLTLFKDGYHAVQQHLYLAPNSDQKIQYVMQPLSAGEPNDTRPTPAANESDPTKNEPPQNEGQPPPGYGGRGAPPPYQPGQGQPGQQMPPPGGGYGRGEPPPQKQPPPQQPPEVQVDPRTFGALSLLVQPSDADLLIDGAKWPGALAGESRVIIQLPEGRHHIEISKDGFARYVEDVGIQRGRTLSLNVSLIRRPGGGQ